MTYRKFLWSLQFVALVLLLSPSLAQDEYSYAENVLDSSELKDLSDLSQYNKTEKKLMLKEHTIDESEIPESDISFGFGPILTALLYVLILSLVVFILFVIFSSIKVDKKVKATSISKVEEIEDIEVIDAESGLELALKSENYREALRMLFIKLLQVLVQEKHIEWKPEKTNRNYLKEMSKHEKFLHFNNLVIAYERIWYGSEPIDKLFFDYLRVDFEKFYSTKSVQLDVKE